MRLHIFAKRTGLRSSSKARRRSMSRDFSGVGVRRRDRVADSPIASTPSGVGPRRCFHKNHSDLLDTVLPDGHRLLELATENLHGLRVYARADGTGLQACYARRDCSRQGIARRERIAALLADGRINIYPVDGGDVYHVPGILPGDIVDGWTEDNRSLYVSSLAGVPTKAFRVDIATGKREYGECYRPRTLLA